MCHHAATAQGSSTDGAEASLSYPRRACTNLRFLSRCLVSFLISVCAARAQLSTSESVLSRSRSGQFIIQAEKALVASSFVSNLEKDTNFVRLDPTILPVSCERIKQILYR